MLDEYAGPKVNGEQGSPWVVSTLSMGITKQQANAPVFLT